MANLINTKVEPIGLMFISEATNTPGVVNNLSRNKNSDLFFVTFDTNLQDFDVINRNKRYYDASNVMSQIKDNPKLVSLIQTGGWFGEWEHPFTEFKADEFSAKRLRMVPPEKRAFKILNPLLKGNVLTATIQSAQGPLGEGYGKEVLAGWIPQYSARSFASMINKNGKPYIHMNELVTYDSPWYPSHACAHMTSTPTVTVKSFTESVNESDTYYEGVMVSLKDILKEISNTDPNTNMILESFGLTLENMEGFTDDKKRVIIKDDNNVIYANINPNTVKKVKDFYASF